MSSSCQPTKQQTPFLFILAVSVIAGCNQGKPLQQTAPPATTAQIAQPHPPKPIARYQIAHHGLVGFIDATGNEVINPQFDDADDFAEGYAPVRKGAKWGYIDPNGRVAISYQFDKALDFASGLAPVSVHGKWAYIGTSGKIVINPQFDSAEPFSEDLAAVKLSDRWGFIDKTGKLAINPQFQSTETSETSSSFSQGLCLEPDTTSTADGGAPRYGYIGPDGKWAISPQFDMALDFKENLAPAESGDRWGYIGKTGTFTINPQFDQAKPFSDDRALVKLGTSYGYIGLDGKYVINPQYDDAGSFSENLAAVKQGKRWGYINPDGTFAINPQFDDALPFTNGLAMVFLNEQLGYINPTGKFVWGPVSVASVLKPTKPQPTPSATQTPAAYASGQLVPDSSSRLLSETDLAGRSPWQLTIIRNEIYARHGLIFKRSDLNTYFSGQSWYRPTTSDAAAVEGFMNGVERQNTVYVRDYEAAHGLQ